jgi:hypothetical protein
MGSSKTVKNKLKSKIEVIKKINDNPKQATDDLYDLYLKDMPSTDKLFGKKFGDLLTKTSKKKENNKNIFADIIEIAEGFLGSNKTKGDTDKIFSISKIRKHATDSAKKTLSIVKQTVLDNAQKTFFSGDGICGTNKLMTIDNLTIAPSEFDFLNVLTVEPSSSIGQIVYENPNQLIGKEKVNRKLFETFTGPDYQFNSITNNTLFTMHWNSGIQQYAVSGLTQGNPTLTNVTDFFNDYYSTIEMPDITGITKNAMAMLLQGGEGDNPMFHLSLNNLNRLLSKLFAVCGTSTQGNQPLKETPITQFNENDEDIESYFDFNDVEGIDIDDESARFRKVLKFTDCNNFEVPVNPILIEDFIYLLKKQSLNDVVNITLNRASLDAFDQSDTSIPTTNFNISLMNNFILNLPKALIMSVMTPKIFLPIVMIYKMFKSGISVATDIKDLMKKLSKMFWSIVKDLFWNFLRGFWKLIKVDLLAFVSKIAQKILKNKYKRYLAIITSLISMLKSLLEEKIDNCYDMFNVILTTINGAIKGGRANSIPSLLLSLSSQLPGYSQDRAYMNICERLEAAGVSLSPIYGEDNKLPSMIKSIIDGHTEEEDNNSFISGGNQLVTIPVVGVTGGAVVLTPGIISIFGKKR